MLLLNSKVNESEADHAKELGNEIWDVSWFLYDDILARHSLCNIGPIVNYTVFLELISYPGSVRVGEGVHQVLNFFGYPKTL